MFRIKICGITNVEDAISALEAADVAIGLNFYEKSPRCVSTSVARMINEQLLEYCDTRNQVAPGSGYAVYPVGVFVNHSSEEIFRIFEEARLFAAQLHGDEPPGMVGDLSSIPVIRVQRFNRQGRDALITDLAACRNAIAATQELKTKAPYAILVDAAAVGQYGGSGETLPWHDLSNPEQWLGSTPLILAGGLTPDNVAEAIRIVRPAAIDVASGVESAPGKKDPYKVGDFIAAAQDAFESLES